MDWNYLISLRQAKKEAEQILGRIEELESRMYLPSGQRFSLTPRGGSSGRTMDDLIIAHDTLLQKYKDQLITLDRQQAELEDAMKVLTWNERAVIRYWVLDHMSCESIGRRMNYAPRQIYRIREAAVRKLEGIHGAESADSAGT